MRSIAMTMLHVYLCAWNPSEHEDLVPSSKLLELHPICASRKVSKCLEIAWSAKHTLNVRIRGLVTGERIRADAHLHTKVRDGKKLGEGRGQLLGFFGWWWVCDEVNAFRDVALEALDALLKELLLIGIGATNNVDGFLCTGRLLHLDQHE
jgi:hypothetical protein